jgi:ubiquinone biosynthesis protein COQ4
MSDFTDSKQQWENTLFSSIVEMARAADGDFAVLGQLAAASGDPESLQIVIDRLSQQPQGKKAFASYFSLGAIDLEELHRLPTETLGYLYAEHMLSNQLKPLQADLATNDHQFFAAHITETHDVWHVLTGSTTDILGEIQLEAFYVAQLEASRFWLALLTKNLMKSVVYDIDVATDYMEVMTNGWLMGRKAEPLFGINWSTLWTKHLEEIRVSLNIDIAL